MRASITFAAGQSSEIGRYDMPCEESLPGLGMGMTNEVFLIEGTIVLLFCYYVVIHEKIRLIKQPK